MAYCVLAEVSAAVEDMLAHRGWAWTPGDADACDAFAFLWPAACACSGSHTVLFRCDGPPNTALLVTDQQKIGMNQLRQAYEALVRLGLRRLQLIVHHAVTTQTMNLNHSLPSDHDISMLLWTQVLLRPLDHTLVPRHRRATPEERARLTPVTQLPTLRADDAVAQYLGLRSGEVVRIQRADDTLYWRLIV